jgi:hypothetical protein
MQSGYFLQVGDPEKQEAVQRGPDAINLYPSAAGLPWFTGFAFVRQNKHWKEVLHLITTFLKSFATDNVAKSIVLSNGTSLATLAEKEIFILTDSWLNFSIYMWPEADEERAKLVAATLLLTFLFDG